MFVRQHNSFTDPVALRNIGKRTSDNSEPAFLGTEPAFLGNTMEFFDPQYEFDYPTDMPAIRQDEKFPLFDFRKSRKQKTSVTDYDDVYKSNSVLGNILKSPEFLSQLEEILSKDESRSDKGSSLNQPKSKRQIICPPGMPRIACYDNALAFYIQIMKTMNHKRFV